MRLLPDADVSARGGIVHADATQHHRIVDSQSFLTPAMTVFSAGSRYSK